MVQYLRKVDEVPGFSDIPLPGHEKAGAFDKILIDPVTGSKNFMMLWAKVEAGAGPKMHTHAVEQAYFVLTGALKVTIAGKEYIAKANTSILLPAGVEHALTPQGKEPATFLIIFAPPLDSFASRPH